MTETSEVQSLPETFTLENQLPDGTMVSVAVMVPNLEWWETVRPGSMLSLPVAAVLERHVVSSEREALTA